MVTKKQHYYPRCLLKYFADSKDKVYVYSSHRKSFNHMNYSKICASNKTYETDDVIDNILENNLAKYETKMGGILDEILNRNIIEISEEKQNFIYKFFYLQYFRTDSGRIKLMQFLYNPYIYKPRKYPLEYNDILNNKKEIKKFNEVFKDEKELELLLKIFEKPKDMVFRICTTKENLITSDNPVIGTDNGQRIFLPINPHICFQFKNKKFVQNNSLFTVLTQNHVDYLNKATINTANYFVISNLSFTNEEKQYIINRFKNPSSIRKLPFFDNSNN